MAPALDTVAFAQRCLLPLLPAFRATYPKLEFELVLTDEKIDLIARRIDLAVRLGPAVETDLIAAWLIYPSRAFLPQKVRMAVDFLRANLPRWWRPGRSPSTKDERALAR